jgi:hypothetical protein
MKKCTDCWNIVLILNLLLGFSAYTQRVGTEFIGKEKSPFVSQISNLELIYHNKPSINFLLNVSENKWVPLVDSEKEIFNIDHGCFHQIKDEVPCFFTQNIRFGGKNVTLSLEKTVIHTPDFHILTSEGQKIFPDVSDMLFYTGIIQGSEQSLVTLSIFDDEWHYLISSGQGNYEIHISSDGLGEGHYSKINTSYHNDIIDSLVQIPSPGSRVTTGNRSGNCIEIFMECDYHTHLALGNNIDATNIWISNLFNNVAAVYAMHQVPLVLRQVFIWTNSDPYTSATNPGQWRDLFVAHRQNNYNGKLAILVSSREIGGGIANGIGGYCNSYPEYPGPQCVGSNLNLNNNGNGNFSYNTYLIAHEIGHVMGLRHTNACVWENNFVQIDDCGNVWAEQNGQAVEGSTCYNSASPILPSSGGTIMSNCHLLNQVGINLSNGFGAIAGKVLYDQYVYASCVTGTSCNNQAPVNDLCNNAISLPVNYSCKNFRFSNHNATSSQNPVPFSCGNGGNPVKDVWFKIEIPPSGSVTIATSQTSGGLTDLIMEVYAGNCNSLQPVTCDDNSGEANHALIKLNNRTPGEIVWIRVADHMSDQDGMFNICANDTLLPCHPDFAAMMSFYNDTGGTQWSNKTGWQNGANGTDCNVCNWFGVRCNAIGRVSAINLPSNNVTSSGLPADLANLHYLTELRLYNNKISGNVPSVIMQLTKLMTLDLGRNLLVGNIPSSLGNIASLKNLYLDNNQLSGSLPLSITTLNLSLIYLNDNNLSGCFPASYVTFCSKAYNFAGNTQLANGVSFDDFCSLGSGVDLDADGYCRQGLDCDDNNPLIHPLGIEICNLKDDNCNGLTDDIGAPLTNNWIGASGNWDNVTNWSLGSIPGRCHNVVIGGSGSIIITIPSGVTAYARSVTVSSGKTLTISGGSNLYINHGLNLTNSGTINNYGLVNISNIHENTSFGINNHGVINNQTSGNITITNSGSRSISNNAGGTFTNSGVLTIDKNAFNLSSTGLYNAGTFTNNENINIRNITGTRLHITAGSTFTNQINGFLNIE